MSKNIVDAITHNSCLLCGGRTYPLIDDELDVTYDVCPSCRFVYKQPLYHVSPEDEKQRYLQHHNEEQNIGYVTYLKSFIQSSILPLQGVKTILDFGSGPYPMLQQLLAQQGYIVDTYDPFFHNDLSYQDKQYDLIVLTEVLEHVHQPLQTLQSLLPLLKNGGRLLIMTQFRPDTDAQFLRWWYRRDTTHVGFYHDTTFVRLAKTLSCQVETTNHIDRILLTHS